MRKGYNPYKDTPLEETKFSHQVVIPVYIPHHHGYFEDVFKLLKLCLKSLFKTSHSKTFICVVDNGSCREVNDYLRNLLLTQQVQELITTENIGKLNAIIKGVGGHDIPLVTITDADILFLSGWQSETVKVFNSIPKAGIVGLIPQFLTYQDKSENVLYELLWDENLQFVEVKNAKALAAFYKSIGWKPNYPKARLKYTLGLKAQNGHTTNVGSGHAVATYRRELFNLNFPLYNDFQMGGGSEQILDSLAIKNGCYRLTTYDNYAYHLGNVYEDWMEKILISQERTEENPTLNLGNIQVRQPGLFAQFKEKLMKKALKSHKIRMLFLKHKGLPKEVRKSF
ncbi:glycosyltransferase family 2 protein [Salegentibacter sp. BDJ18]|uniref:glycosyltransferase n=1 Tax=Salegentibacter sp. BDJ18 TaxID=2816376 RepID=UPI001AAE2029|nr:glycosyltransferase [Salegentibacter sp. BDJ18]MBO2544274.1 glycosyltransferase family 2 protein [Salegentibacter sp. BDJ18]